MTNPTSAGEVRVALASSDHLGEGPHWDETTHELLRVDITHGLVHRWRPGAQAGPVTCFEGEVSAAIPRRAGGLIVALGHALLVVEPDGRHHRLATVEQDLPHNRFND